jgi:hypothetical protein
MKRMGAEGENVRRTIWFLFPNEELMKMVDHNPVVHAQLDGHDEQYIFTCNMSKYMPAANDCTIACMPEEDLPGWDEFESKTWNDPRVYKFEEAAFVRELRKGDRGLEAFCQVIVRMQCTP